MINEDGSFDRVGVFALHKNEGSWHSEAWFPSPALAQVQFGRITLMRCVPHDPGSESHWSWYYDRGSFSLVIEEMTRRERVESLIFLVRGSFQAITDIKLISFIGLSLSNGTKKAQRGKRAKASSFSL